MLRAKKNHNLTTPRKWPQWNEMTRQMRNGVFQVQVSGLKLSDTRVSWFHVRPEITRYPLKMPPRALLSIEPKQVAPEMAGHSCLLLLRAWPSHHTGRGLAVSLHRCTGDRDAPPPGRTSDAAAAARPSGPAPAVPAAPCSAAAPRCQTRAAPASQRRLPPENEEESFTLCVFVCNVLLRHRQCDTFLPKHLHFQPMKTCAVLQCCTLHFHASYPPAGVVRSVLEAELLSTSCGEDGSGGRGGGTKGCQCKLFSPL